jgi:hypothetical protein
MLTNWCVVRSALYSLNLPFTVWSFCSFHTPSPFLFEQKMMVGWGNIVRRARCFAIFRMRGGKDSVAGQDLRQQRGTLGRNVQHHEHRSVVHIHGPPTYLLDQDVDSLSGEVVNASCD